MIPHLWTRAVAVRLGKEVQRKNITKVATRIPIIREEVLGASLLGDRFWLLEFW